MTSLRTPFAGVFAVAMLLFGTSAASQAASVETSCVGYARAVTDHLRPNAPKGSPEYRAVYFPTLEECRRRGGSAAMPGGLAAAPWYLPRPAAPRANPYTPPPPAASSSGGSSSGLPTPPAPPSANPYNPPPASSSGLPRPPAPPANPYNPAANPNPPAPPPGSPNPPATAGKTPAEIVAYGKQKVAQSLPGGMSFPAAVRAAIDGCGALALAQANAAGANGSAAWQKAASDAVSRCISQGGAINGQFTLSRDLDLALRMAKHKTAPFERAAGVPGNNACAPLTGDSDYKSCVTEAGQWFICYRAACHLAQPGLFPAAGASPSVSLFYNCPGAQCRTISSPKGTECRRDENDGQTYCLNDSGQMCVQQSNGGCTHVADIVYVGDKPTLVPVPGQHITRGMAAFFLFRCPTCAFPNVDDPRRFPSPAAIVGVNGEFDVQDKFNFDSCKWSEGSDWAKVRQCFFEKCRQSRAGQSFTPTQVDASCARAFDHQKKRWNEYNKREIAQRFQNVPERVNEFWDAHGDTVVLAAVVVGGLALALFFPPAGGILAMGAVGTAGAVLIGVGAGSAGGGITGKSYGELGIQACRPTVERLVSEDPAVRALDPARHAAVKDFFIELCALNLPDIEQIRAMQRGTYQSCEQRARYAQPINGAPQIVAASRRLNECLRGQAVQAAEKGLLPREAGTRFADQWSDLLRSCSASSGLQWRGDLASGAAWPVGAPAGDPLAALSGCVVAGIK